MQPQPEAEEFDIVEDVSPAEAEPEPEGEFGNIPDSDMEKFHEQQTQLEYNLVEADEFTREEHSKDEIIEKVLDLLSDITSVWEFALSIGSLDDDYTFQTNVGITYDFQRLTKPYKKRLLDTKNSPQFSYMVDTIMDELKGIIHTFLPELMVHIGSLHSFGDTVEDPGDEKVSEVPPE